MSMGVGISHTWTRHAIVQLNCVRLSEVGTTQRREWPMFAGSSWSATAGFGPRCSVRCRLKCWPYSLYSKTNYMHQCIKFILFWNDILHQCFSTAGPRPGTGPWHQLYRAARDSPGIRHFIFLSNFHE